MRCAGVSNAYLVLRGGKWDIPAYLGDGSAVGVHLAYLMMRLPFGVPYTIDQAYPFVETATVAFGFPDIVFQPDDAFAQLLAQLEHTGADVVLGLFPAQVESPVDRVEVCPDGRVSALQLGPTNITLHYTWIIAVWTPVFTRFMHAYLPGWHEVTKPDGGSGGYQPTAELSMGEVFQASIEKGLDVVSLSFAEKSFVDIGTPGNLLRAARGLD
jgi:glucose-1-phosphate thymidylyltransferase